MKLKYNFKLLKWVLTIAILLLNFTLIGSDDKVFLITVGLSVNFCGISVFVFLSIFPRNFYVIDENGISYQKADGTEKWYIAKQNIIDVEEIGFGFGLIYVETIVTYMDNKNKLKRPLRFSYAKKQEAFKILNINNDVIK